jgi:hypothetical protein
MSVDVFTRSGEVSGDIAGALPAPTLREGGPSVSR